MKQGDSRNSIRISNFLYFSPNTFLFSDGIEELLYHQDGQKSRDIKIKEQAITIPCFVQCY